MEPADPADPGLKLSRLEGFRAHLLDTELPELYEMAMLHIRDEDRVLEVAGRQMASWSSHTVTTKKLQRLDHTIKGLVIEQFVHVLQHKLPKVQFPASFQLSEDEFHRSRRDELQARLRSFSFRRP